MYASPPQRMELRSTLKSTAKYKAANSKADREVIASFHTNDFPHQRLRIRNTPSRASLPGDLIVNNAISYCNYHIYSSIFVKNSVKNKVNKSRVRTRHLGLALKPPCGGLGEYFLAPFCMTIFHMRFFIASLSRNRLLTTAGRWGRPGHVNCGVESAITYKCEQCIRRLVLGQA